MRQHNKAIEEEFCRRLSATKDYDEALQFLRESGFTKMECVKMLVDAGALTLAKAKEVVHFSKSWSDQKATDEQFADNLVKDLNSSVGKGSE